MSTVQSSLALADRGHPVTGIDSSPEMIALFRANLPDQVAEAADMRSISLDGRPGAGTAAVSSMGRVSYILVSARLNSHLKWH